MRRPIFFTLAGIACLSLCACTTAPYAPDVAAMPSPYKPFDVFAQDQANCEAYAANRTDPGVRAANNQQAGSTIAGAALGALIGGAAGGRHSTGLGAATGAAIGAMSGADASANAEGRLQRQFDAAYSQCMYARGNQVSGYASALVPRPPVMPPAS